ncbi:hypothetical protein [Deinococcus soli (ex Cha et al. 2016)]|uniref:Uncharacterized protein n=2 Tax=Deinococcus soli (ex Cha et al. 2016) TaxID=1309411 RepID=A0ACC6KFX7_9DEIO|nr:hypothetical protein [Deinococcus soli (ex Cha et al. 2016)]MDR6218347.1 hypothetical protein [Deinococcus soli (ex Cha et al. 2016)]MDR6329087.1 hypothetical protein [Deinococcus soli (ex Cha et al. 2016)]MDR6751360.1 hypothetical protein [Deinococcus soli (ex Cha et al. 2016)]
MREHTYEEKGRVGPVTVTVYRDLYRAVVIFAGRGALESVEELATHTYDKFLSHLGDNVQWVVRDGRHTVWVFMQRQRGRFTRPVQVHASDEDVQHDIACLH